MYIIVSRFSVARRFCRLRSECIPAGEVRHDLDCSVILWSGGRDRIYGSNPCGLRFAGLQCLPSREELRAEEQDIVVDLNTS